MSKLQDLINQYCPNGVEYILTKDITTDRFWLMPSTPNYIQDGIPYITSKNIKNGEIHFDNVNYISKDDYITISKNRSIQKDDLLITMIGTIGEVAIVDNFNEFYGQNIYLIRINKKLCLNKYYYYYLTSQKIKNSLITKKNTSSQGYIKAGSIDNLKIPVPPLPVQEEIVRILDAFTELTQELTQELTLRKKQYEYYRDKLLDFGDDVEWRNLQN